MATPTPLPPKTRLVDFGKKNNRVSISFDPAERRTEQHHAKSVNINTIMARYHKTGVIDHVNKHGANYGDVTGMDFHTAQNLVATQKTVFAELPAYARDHFQNDVQKYLTLVATPEGAEALQDILHPADEYNKDGSPMGDPLVEPPDEPSEPTPADPPP